MAFRPIDTTKVLKTRIYTQLSGPWNGRYTIAVEPVDVVYTKVSATTGVDVANYRDKLRKHENASSNYSTRWIDVKDVGRCRHTFDYFDVGNSNKTWDLMGEISLVGPGWNLETIPSDSTLRDIALGRFKNKVADENAQFALLTNLAELRELPDLVRQISLLVRNVRRIYADVRHLNVSRLSGRLSELWLTFSFGVSPLLGEAASLAEAIAASLSEGYHSSYTGKAKSTWVSYSSLGNQAVGYNTRTTVICRKEHTLTYKYRGGVHIRPRNAAEYSAFANAMYALRDNLGVTPSGVLSAAWELLPFSWVADYFATVGAFLGDVISTDDGQSLDYLTLSTKYVCKKTFLTVNASAVTQYASNISESTTFGIVEEGSYVRTVLPVIPVRALRFKTPEEVSKHIDTKIANLLAVLLSKKSSSRR